MRDVNHEQLITRLTPKLTEITVAPEWANYVKTGHGKQRPPVRKDWWLVRSAALLLTIEKLGPVGVSKLSIKYGNRKNRGVQPEKFARGSRNIIRKILQQLESASLIEQTKIGSHKGRILTKKGQRLIIDSAKEAKKA